MRCIRCFLTAFCAVLLVTASASSQSKDKDKKETSRFPTEISGKDLDAWMKDLRDKDDPTIRQVAIRTVPHFGPPAQKALPSLIAAVKEGDAGLRVDATVALGQVMAGLDPKKDEANLTKGIAMLTEALRDEQRSVRLSAMGALSYFGFYARPAIKQLAITIHDPQSWEVRKTAAQTLGRLGVATDPKEGPDPTAMKELTEALKDPCAPVRLEAVMALSMLGTSPRANEVAAEKAALENRYKADRDKVVQLWALTLLMFLDEKTWLNSKNLNSLAATYMNDTDLRVRCQAASALGQLGAKAQPKLKELVEAANDREQDLALTATASLGRLDDPLAVPELVKLLKSKNSEVAVKCAAAQALGALGAVAKPAVGDLTEVLKGKDTDLAVKCAAARSLGALGMTAKASVTDLTDVLKEKESDLVIAALEALVAMGPDLAKTALPAIKELKASKDDVIKEGATEAEKRLTADKPKT